MTKIRRFTLVITLLILFIVVPTAFAATLDWTFVKGRAIPNQPGIYDDPHYGDNYPGARTESISWTDASGNFWLLGGGGYAKTNSTGSLNDLWKLDPLTGNWTFIRGTGDYLDETSVYSDADPGDIIPGGRGAGMAWADSAGTLWLYGGWGYATVNGGTLNDLWRFDPSTGNWAFIRGTGDYINEDAVYNDPNPANNQPGSRHNAATWTDASGNFWLFGGVLEGSSGSGLVNDVWKFDPLTGNWTFVRGSGDYFDEYGVYNDPNPANNHPGSRYTGVSWTDTSGNLWLFGGVGFAESGEAQWLNDLWKFDTSTGNWTFITGSGDYLAEYSVYNDPNPANNHPGSRGDAVGWMDSAGNLWLFGGGGYAAADHGPLNDLWKFDPSTSIWTFVKGYGDFLRESSVVGYPGSRLYSVAWTDLSGNFWLFGGGEYPYYYNDLWKFSTPASPSNIVSVRGAGNGSGTITETGINCTSINGIVSSDCAEAFPPGTPIQLEAIPSTGSVLTSWTGCDSTSGTNNEICHITLSTDRTVMATFTLMTFTLTGMGSGSGSGGISNLGDGCYITAGTASGDCSETFNYGTKVSLSAWASPGSDFVSWTGCDSTSHTDNSGCAVTIWADTTITAHIDLETYWLEVYSDGASNGTVTGTGINCTLTADTRSGDCSEFADYGTAFQLTPSPEAGSVFVGWSFCTFVDENDICHVTLNSHTFVTATFGFETHTLTAAGDGTGSGTITATGITCTSTAGTESGDCAEPIEVGTAVTLTAAPTSGSFAGWTGCDSTSGTNNQNCNITVNSAATVTAAFDLDPSALSAANASPTQIDLMWTDNGSAETGFSIERSPDGSTGWTEVAATAANATSHPDTGQLCGGWFYRVRAIFPNGLYSAYTNIDGGAPCHIFDDMPAAGKAWMENWVDLFYASGFTGGCGLNPRIFCPERKVTRAELAVFLVRAYHHPNLPHTPTNQGGTFADVPVVGKEWMEDWIEEFYDLGITGGCSLNPRIFCPEREVTRAEIAVFILRAVEGASYQPPAASDYFSDVPVPGKAWMEPWIDEFYRRGITTGCGLNPRIFCPEQTVTRAEMAVFILRAFDSLPKP